MFGTLGNGFRLLIVSSRFLASCRDLMLLPLMGAAGLLFVFVYAVAAFWGGGTFDRIGPDYRFYLADVAFLALAYFLASFVMVVLVAAMAGAAYQKLEGFTPDLSTGLIAANDRLTALAGWSVLAASVVPFLNELSSSRSLIGRPLRFLWRLLWDYNTSFVVPVVVIDSASPLDALGRSTDLFREHWGRTFVANYSFAPAYVLTLALAAGLAALVYFGLGSSFLAVTAGAVLLSLGVALVKALVTIYNVALYDFAATGRVGGGFSGSMLRDAYVWKQDRGRFRPDELSRPPRLRRAA